MTRQREYLFSVSLSDCEVQTFRAGGKGGQNQNKRSTGVRVIHHPSGARGEARENRTQLENKKAAFHRMAETSLFINWCKIKARNLPPLDEIVDAMMENKNLKIEIRDERGKWVEDTPPQNLESHSQQNG